MTNRLIGLSCCRRHLSHLQLSCSLPSHSLFVFLSAFVWTARFTLSQLTQQLLGDQRRRAEVRAVQLASAAECLQYGERRTSADACLAELRLLGRSTESV